MPLMVLAMAANSGAGVDFVRMSATICEVAGSLPPVTRVTPVLPFATAPRTRWNRTALGVASHVAQQPLHRADSLGGRCVDVAAQLGDRVCQLGTTRQGHPEHGTATTAVGHAVYVTAVPGGWIAAAESKFRSFYHALRPLLAVASIVLCRTGHVRVTKIPLTRTRIPDRSETLPRPTGPQDLLRATARSGAHTKMH